MKKILISVLALMLVIGLVGAGTVAYFTDTETSSANTFTAGTVDLQLSNDAAAWANGVTGTWVVGDNKWEPGDNYASILYMDNEGTSGALLVRIKCISVTEGENGVSDAEGKYYTANNLWPNGQNNIADYIILTEINPTEYGDWMGNLIDYYKNAGPTGQKMDQNQDGKVTLREFCNWPYSMVFWKGNCMPENAIEDYFLPGSTQVQALKLGFQFDKSAGNWLQSDQATFTLRVIADDDPAILGKGGACDGYAE